VCETGFGKILALTQFQQKDLDPLARARQTKSNELGLSPALDTCAIEQKVFAFGNLAF